MCSVLSVIFFAFRRFSFSQSMRLDSRFPYLATAFLDQPYIVYAYDLNFVNVKHGKGRL